jgi:hypothetical protein
MNCVIAAKLKVIRAFSQLFFVMLHPRGRIKLVARAGQVKHCGAGILIKLARFPVARQPAAFEEYSLSFA